MQQYIINRNPDEKGFHEVHNNDSACPHLPQIENRILLGIYSDEVEAVKAAKIQGYLTADGCYHCCRKAHRG